MSLGKKSGKRLCKYCHCLSRQKILVDLELSKLSTSSDYTTSITSHLTISVIVQLYLCVKVNAFGYIPTLFQKIREILTINSQLLIKKPRANIFLKQKNAKASVEDLYLESSILICILLRCVCVVVLKNITAFLLKNLNLLNQLFTNTNTTFS